MASEKHIFILNHSNDYTTLFTKIFSSKNTAIMFMEQYIINKNVKDNEKVTIEKLIILDNPSNRRNSFINLSYLNTS